MAICKECSNEMNEDDKWCPSCGATTFTWRGLKIGFKGILVSIVDFFLEYGSSSMNAPLGKVLSTVGYMSLLIGWAIAMWGFVVHAAEILRRFGKP